MGIEINTAEEFEKLIQICHSNLKNSSQCIEYLKDRGLTGEDVRKYRLGYFPQSVKKLTQHVSPKLLNSANIADVVGYSRFRDYYYLTIPIFSEYGEPVGISGRALLKDEERQMLNLPKYLNSSYKKANILYGLNHSAPYILDKKNVYVVEGYFDFIAMDKNGVKNTVAICGTAFSKNHLVKLSRYTKRITFILDSDDAGQKSMSSIYKKFSSYGIALDFLSFTDGSKDAGEYFSKKDKSAKTLKQDLSRMLVGWS